jgi:hypothetical protein
LGSKLCAFCESQASDVLKPSDRKERKKERKKEEKKDHSSLFFNEAARKPFRHLYRRFVENTTLT